MTIVKQICCDVRDFRDALSQQPTITLNLKTCAEVSKFFFHRILTIQNKNQRCKTACSKTRAEVRGGGRKPWKQKGTGRARAGSSVSPLWKGGGVVFGPKPTVYNKKINFKERQLAIFTGLYACSYKIVIVRNFVSSIAQPRTKAFLGLLSSFDPSLLSKRILILVPKATETLYSSCRNVEKITIGSRKTLTLRDIFLADSILIAEEALPEFLLV
ncbi:ribosomal protein L4 (plastid) [Cryptomonas paramecium]|uniref:Large ribosomal subunit protein uL4c n=1 Tax=Cryptomonas paramaecium TaxID=2898 RepID=D2IS95_9CRYP|nr:ribosomal protein L4 [Cryptomonas paramecium]ACT46787.1 ribosomal protein L4 [Cryptomonas paramecium]BDA98008.1 ribosomal protein L4 [Cryptomonas paramecium]